MVNNTKRGMKIKKIKGMTLSLFLLGSLFFIVPITVAADVDSRDDNHLFAIPVDIYMTPGNITEKKSTITKKFDLYFGGGTGTFRYTFNPDNGIPAKSGSVKSTKFTVKDITYSLQQYETKNTWYPKGISDFRYHCVYKW